MDEVGHEAREERLPTAATRNELSEPEPRRDLAKAAPRERRESPSSLQRTASALRTAVPLVQKLLPLLDGNVASAVANFLAPGLLSGPSVDLSPLETSLMKLRGELAVIQDRNAQHDVALKRIDDQLQTMKEAVERTGLEHREMAQEVSKVRKNVLVFSLIGIGLLVVSIGMNVALFLSMKGSFR